MSSVDEPSDVGEVLDSVEDAGAGRKVSVEEIVEEIGDRSFGPLLLVPAIILVSPASGIPSVPTIGSLIISLIAIQMVIGCKRLWLPAFIRNRRIDKNKLDRALGYMRKPAVVIDRLTRPRLTFLTERPFTIFPAAVWSAMVLFAPAFETVPFSVSVIAGAVALFALALVAKDGVVMIVALFVLVAAVLGGVSLLR
jgi:hypothetical protein